ncbi:hypothetical protein CC80DRAFT_160856 [Byssothecium circinans]|uniref:Uncharacterized protein n=1 Tax=Byssothecium circinans TaxID=147558 RepID=A0A6A5UER6_9PLEO|nr:hypothetical protein CC80DRAFT_160856 [Byssothecium circinans]
MYSFPYCVCGETTRAISGRLILETETYMSLCAGGWGLGRLERIRRRDSGSEWRSMWHEALQASNECARLSACSGCGCGIWMGMICGTACRRAESTGSAQACCSSAQQRLAL